MNIGFYKVQFVFDRRFYRIKKDAVDSTLFMRVALRNLRLSIVSGEYRYCDPVRRSAA